MVSSASNVSGRDRDSSGSSWASSSSSDLSSFASLERTLVVSIDMMRCKERKGDGMIFLMDAVEQCGCGGVTFGVGKLHHGNVHVHVVLFVVRRTLTVVRVKIYSKHAAGAL